MATSAFAGDVTCLLQTNYYGEEVDALITAEEREDGFYQVVLDVTKPEKGTIRFEERTPEQVSGQSAKELCEDLREKSETCDKVKGATGYLGYDGDLAWALIFHLTDKAGKVFVRSGMVGDVIARCKPQSADNFLIEIL